MLGRKAAFWVVVMGICIAVPWSRQFCAPGRPMASSVVAAIAVGAGAAVVSVLRRVGVRPRPYDAVEALALATVLIALSTGEEVAFRGVLLMWLSSWSTPWLGLATSSILFGLSHRFDAGSKVAVVHVFTGLVFGAVALGTGGWAGSAAVHCAYNGVAIEWARPYRSGSDKPTRSTA